MSDKKDVLKGDHSFRMWFKIMWKNGYILYFLLGLSGIITQLILWNDMIYTIKDNFDYWIPGGIMTFMAMCLPITINAMAAYKAFYQYWSDLKNNTSR